MIFPRAVILAVAVVFFYPKDYPKNVCEHFRAFDNYDFHNISSKL